MEFFHIFVVMEVKLVPKLLTLLFKLSPFNALRVIFVNVIEIIIIWGVIISKEMHAVSVMPLIPSQMDYN